MRKQLEELIAKWERKKWLSGHNDAGKEFALADCIKDVEKILESEPETP